MSESLREAVESQARAYVRGDHAAFASYMTAQALLQLRGNGHRPRNYRVMSVSERDGVGQSSVVYRGGGRIVLEQRWERRGDAWKAIDAVQNVEEKRALWRRLLRRDEKTGE